MKKHLCDCGKEGIKKITNGYICKRCHAIEKSLYKDARNGNLFKFMPVYDKKSYSEIGRFSLS